MKRLKCLNIMQKSKCKKSCGKYLQLIYSASLKYNPLNNNETFHYTETFEGNKEDKRDNNSEGRTENKGDSRTTGASTSSSTSSSSNLQINNDTPQRSN